MTTSSLPKVCLITVGWNQIDKTIACLGSINSLHYKNLSVIVVDNGSTDDTSQTVRRDFPKTKLIRSESNLGFSGGYNLGIRYALEQECDYIYLTNNDTILAPDSLNYLVDSAETSKSAGLLTAKIYYLDQPQKIWSVGTQVNRLLLEIIDKAHNTVDTGQWSETTKVEFAPLCSVLIRSEVFTSVGLLDERFFLYYEDMDFCHRLRQHNWQLLLVPNSHVWHAVSASSGGINSPSERYWMARSSIIYFAKQAKFWQYPPIIFWRSASAIRTTIRLLRQKQYQATKAYWHGLLDGVKCVFTT